MEFLKEILGEGYAAFETSIKGWNEKPENKDKQVKIANVNSGNYVSKAKYDALDIAKKGLETQLQTATENLKKFEGIEDPTKLQGEITRLTGELETQKTTYEGKIADMQFGTSLEAAIASAGGRNTKAIKALLDIEKLKSSKDQSADIKAALEECKKENDYLFGEANPVGKGDPIGDVGGKQMTAEQKEDAECRAAMGLPPLKGEDK